jgi:site-specific DNA-methyltransferase (adenine-specific)
MEYNKVYLGDCLEVMKSFEDKSIDMILCDLPYGTTACKWDTIIPFEPLWEQYKRIIKDNGAIVLMASQPFTSALVMSNPDMFRYEWIWNKDKAGNIMCSGYQPMKVHENICVFSKSKTIFNKQMTEAIKENIRPSGKEYKNRESIIGIHNWKHSEKRDNTKRNPKSIINISSVSAECNNVNRVHPTQKPVALFEYLIKTYTSVGDTILDNCIGSGTTAVAAINTGRNFIGIEMDKGYCEIARKRILEAREKLASKLPL